jgi:UDP-N-acetylmuramoylalanine--D-glutamate ligase
VNQDLIASTETRVVVGLGVTGLSCARYLTRCGLPFTMFDTRVEPPGLAEFRAGFPDAPLFLGDIPAAVLENASELVVSPGVSPQDPLLAPALDSGVPLLGDIDLFVRAARAPVVGITGSNAKSTVTELVGRMALAAGLRAQVGGNLGTPALDLLDDSCELYVLELSSFQLERAGQLDLAVATVLNISPDHLDRHGSMPRYHQAKHRIFHGCRKAVVNLDDPLTRPLVPDHVQLVGYRSGEPELGGFGLRPVEGVPWLCHGFDTLMNCAELGLAGRHNIGNALAALALGHAAGLPVDAMLQALREFSGLPHRCELVAERADVRYINDSKGTNPGATRAALEGLGGDHNTVLIAGGQGKGADFDDLTAAVAAHCKALVLIGEASRQMQDTFAAVVACYPRDNLQQAVALAAELADQPGDLVLLSPACASFDMFTSYADRGRQFVAAVSALPEPGA